MSTRPAEYYFDLIQGLGYPYFPGAIFPSEMAFFLHSCDGAGVAAIIESGRQDGYSTAVLGRFGDEHALPVISIDIELDPQRAQDARVRLGRYESLKILLGNSYRLIAKFLRTLPAPVALLIDGPKEHDAIYLSSAAAAYGPIALVGHHNTEPGASWHPHFAERFSEAKFFEDSELARDPAAQDFRKWERLFTQEANRNLSQTSLAVANLSPAGPHPSYLQGPNAWDTLNALSLFWSWHVGLAFMPAMIWRRLRRG